MATLKRIVVLVAGVAAAGRVLLAAGCVGDEASIVELRGAGEDGGGDTGTDAGPAQDGMIGLDAADASPPDDAMDAADASDGQYVCSPSVAACASNNCMSRCPTTGGGGDLFRFEGQGATQQVRSLSDCHAWTCQVINDADGGFDCHNPGIGHIGRVCSSSNPSDCSPTAFANFGLGDGTVCGASSCTYACERIN